MILVLTGFLALVIAVSGCAPSLDFDQSQRRVLSEPRITPSTRTVFVISGGSAHYGVMSHEWVGDLPKEMGRRSIESREFSLDLLQHTLSWYVGSAPVIHLGNAVDIGCLQEFNEFGKTMSAARMMWVMTPGEHDGFYLGATNPEGKWKNACESSDSALDQRLTKHRLVSEYLKLLVEQAQKSPKEFGAFGAESEHLQPMGDWKSQNSESFLQRVYWRQDETRPWKSFVLQEISLTRPSSKSPVHAILLDSVNNSVQPYFPRSTTGIWPHWFSVDGLKRFFLGWWLPSDHDLTVNTWLNEADDSNTTIILMGHLSLKASPIAEKIKKWMHRSPTTVLYVSSSDGEGEYRWNAREGSQLLELITGSIGTWPHGFVSFSIGHDRLEAVLLRTSYTTLSRDWEKYGVPKCASKWENSKDGYPSYDQLSGYVDRITGRYGNYARLLQLAQLDIRERLLTNNLTPPGDPSDPPLALNDQTVLARIKDIHSEINWRATSGATEIEDFDLRERIRRKGSQEDYASYRACQALWASKAEYHRTRAPSIQDPYIFLRLPRARATASDSSAPH